MEAVFVRETKSCKIIKWRTIQEAIFVTLMYMIPFVIIFVTNVLVAIKIVTNLIQIRHGSSLPRFLYTTETLNKNEAIVATVAAETQRLEAVNNTGLMICQWNRRLWIRRRTKEAKKTVTTLLVMSLEFIVLNMALPVFFYRQLYLETTGRTYSRESMETFRLVSLALNFSNYCVNFFLYCIHIPKFKAGFLRILKHVHNKLSF
jgi:hypothetical protein